MTTIQVPLDDEVSAALEALCAEQQRDKQSMVSELVSRFIATQQARRALANPDLVALYEELADEDVALAEAGMADYHRLLEEADKE